MATQPKLRAVPKEPVGMLLRLIDEMATLRNNIAQAVGPNDGIDLAIAKDGIAFDLTITLKAATSPERAVMMLEAQPLEGVMFDQIATRPTPRTLNRKQVVARIVAPEKSA